MQNSWKPGICISYGYKVLPYTDYTNTPCIQKVFIATYICKRLTMNNHYDNSHICCIWLEKDPIWFWVKRLTCSFNFASFLCTETHDDDTITHAANDIKRIFLIVGSKILDGRSWSYLDIELCTISTTNATIITHRLMILPSLRQWLLADLHWFWGHNMTGNGQT